MSACGCGSQLKRLFLWLQEEQEWRAAEIEQLKGTIRALNIQMFQACVNNVLL